MIMSTALFGSSGIRRRFDQGLVDLALRTGSVLGSEAPLVVVGTDTRTTSGLIAHAVISGILSAGGDARYCGVVPTPTVAIATRDAGAGCMVTASHNPEPYNGLKLLNPNGSSFTRAQQAHIEEAIELPHWTGWERQGTLHTSDAISHHSDAVLESTDIPQAGITAVVDCGNGAGSVITPQMLTDAGVTVHALNANTAGVFARPSEPLEKNLPYIGAMVRKLQADCALIHDGDADRLMACDARGRYIDGDHLLMLFATYLGCRRVVTTDDASMAIETIAEVRRTPVGDTYVSEELLRWGDFGGEPSGSWIFPAHSYCPDGVYAAALLCEIASEWDIAEELGRMPHYPLLRESVAVESPGEVLTALGAEEPTSGIRMADEDGWCLVRASGTEPRIRITAEGTTPSKAKEMLERGYSLLKRGKVLKSPG